jgi:hypothetical protein
MITENREERRLAAILAADVVGYSRMMGADEVGTLRALKNYRRELIDPESPLVAAGSSKPLAMASSLSSRVRWMQLPVR